MTLWICATCAVEYADTGEPPTICLICTDDRQYVRPSGQRWTTVADLQAAGHRGTLSEVEPGLFGIDIKPGVGIGQRALLVQTDAGNLLWDTNGYLDDDLAAQVEAVGGVAAIAASHPHMFGVQVAWSHRFGDAPVYVNTDDQEWLQRDDPVIRRWREPTEVLPGVTLHRIGGHFPGSAVAHFTGRDGRGVLLSGDTVAGTPDEHWVSFMRSFPNKVPLSAAVVEKVAGRVLALGLRPALRQLRRPGGRRRPELGTSLGRPLHRLGPRRLRPPDRLSSAARPVRCFGSGCPAGLRRCRRGTATRPPGRGPSAPAAG